MNKNSLILSDCFQIVGVTLRARKEGKEENEMAFRHIWAVGKLAERTNEKQAQKAFNATVYSVAKKSAKQADKAKK